MLPYSDKELQKELNGTMPEDMETPSKSLKDIKKDSINYL